MWIKSCRNRRGTALPAIVVLVVVLGVMAVAAVRTTSDDRQASHGVRENTRAFYAAEAGLNLVVANWDSLQYDTLMAAPGDSADLGWVTLSENGASYRAVLHRVDNGGNDAFQVVVNGRSAGGYGGHKKLAVTIASSSVATYGVYGADSLWVRGNGTVTGDVGTNGDIRMQGSALVIGDGTAVGTVNDPSQITGTTTQGAPPLPPLPDVDCPVGPYGPPPTGLSGITWNPVTGDLDLGGDDPKTFVDGTYYYHHFDKGGNGPMVIPMGAFVTIYVSGHMVIGGDGFNNPNMNSENVWIYGCGTAEHDWEIAGDNNSWLNVYAPHAFLDLEGTGNKTGSFTAKALKKGGNGHILWDGGGGLGSGFTPLLGSWIELTD